MAGRSSSWQPRVASRGPISGRVYDSYNNHEWLHLSIPSSCSLLIIVNKLLIHENMLWWLNLTRLPIYEKRMSHFVYFQLRLSVCYDRIYSGVIGNSLCLTMNKLLIMRMLQLIENVLEPHFE